MANVLAEYETLDLTPVQQGIIDTIVKESPLVGAYLPFMEIVGNAYAYNIETALAGMSFYGVGDTWAESAPQWAQRTTALTILGGDIDVDKFVRQTRKNQDIKAALIAAKAKALAHALEKNLVIGLTSTETAEKQFKGLFRLMAECESATTLDLDGVNNDQVFAPAADSTVLTLDYMEELRDRVKPRADCFMLSRRMRRKLGSLARAAGTNLTVREGRLGQQVTCWDDIPVLVNDWVPDNLPDGSSSVLAIADFDPSAARASTKDNSAIFALRFGEDGICGLNNEWIQYEDVGTLETKDADRARLKFYCGLAMFSTLSGAVMINVLDTALT